MPRRWLVFIYRTPQDPPGHRTYVWRRLKQLGALYLQQAAALVPEREDLRASLDTVVVRVRGFGGEASLLVTTSMDAEWERDVLRRFNEARDVEYAELIENIERLEDEIARETRNEKFTFAELEDNEANWEKLQRWWERIDKRDFFGAPGRAGALVALDRARTSLEAFSAEVHSRQGVKEETGGS